MDNFGFQTQGKNYDTFRPKYPQCLYNHTLAKITSKKRFLDIAMGTGQLLFSISPFFKNSKGVDISDKMLQSARSVLSSKYQFLKEKVIIQKCDVMNIPNQQKYDLITVGQALHWFPLPEALNKIKSLLQPDGKFLVLSYLLKKVQGQDQNGKYQRFYEKVKPEFDFDRDQMHNHYTDKKKYAFQNIFGQVIRYSEQVILPMKKDQYVNYLKTYSGYNQYLLKYPQRQNPIKQIQSDKSQQIKVVFEYFKVQCGI